MTTPNPDPKTSDPDRTLLSWPGSEPARGPEPVGDVEGGAAETPRYDPEDAVPALPVTVSDMPGASSLRRAVVDAYDRLADRVLQRMRGMHEDVDADLAELRSEVASLRQAVEDLGDRVQMRAVRTQLDELRSDVVSMRRALLEWPELERVSSDITALRADFTEVVEGMSLLTESAGLTSKGEALGSLQADIAGLRSDLPELRAAVEAQSQAQPWQAAMLAPLVEEIEGMRDQLADVGAVRSELAELKEEVVALRRRVTLRAGSGH